MPCIFTNCCLEAKSVFVQKKDVLNFWNYFIFKRMINGIIH